MSICIEVVSFHERLHRFHRLAHTNTLMLPLKRSETFEAAANSFCLLLSNRSKAVFVQRDLAAELAVPFGHDPGLEENLNQLALVGNDERDVADVDLSPCLSDRRNPIRFPMFPTEPRRAADTRFFRIRGLLPTAWADFSALRGFSTCPAGLHPLRIGSRLRSFGWKPR